MSNNEQRRLGVYSESADTQNPQATTSMEERSVRRWFGDKLYRRTYPIRISIVAGHKFIDFGAITDTTLGVSEVIYEKPTPQYNKKGARIS